MHKPKAGFTLVELMMVIALIGITFAAYPAFRTWMTTLHTNAVMHTLAGDLRLARSKAVNRNHDMVVTFNISARSYSIYSDVDQDGPEINELEKTVTLESIATDVLFGTSAPAGIGGETVASAIQLSGTNPPKVTFKANGEAMQPGTIYMIHRDDGGASKLVRNRAIQILNTGNVREFRYSGSNPSDPWVEYY